MAPKHNTKFTHCLKNWVKSKQSALQTQPQAALRTPVYPVPVIDLLPN